MTQQEVYDLIEQHYREHNKRSVSQANRVTGNPADAEDAVQDAYVRACTYWQTLADADSFESWFTSIARNTAFDVRKKELARGVVKPVLEETVDHEGDSNLVMQWVNRQIEGRMHAESRVILRMHINEGWNTREIADLLGADRTAVYRVVTRFREEMKGKV